MCRLVQIVSVVEHATIFIFVDGTHLNRHNIVEVDYIHAMCTTLAWSAVYAAVCWCGVTAVRDMIFRASCISFGAETGFSMI